MFLYVSSEKGCSAMSQISGTRPPEELNPAGKFPILDTDDFVVEVLNYDQLKTALENGISVENLMLEPASPDSLVPSGNMILRELETRFDFYVDHSMEASNIISSSDKSIMIRRSPTGEGFESDMYPKEVNTLKIAGRRYTFQFRSYNYYLTVFINNKEYCVIVVDDKVTDVWLTYAFKTKDFIVARFTLEHVFCQTTMLGFVWSHDGCFLGVYDIEGKMETPESAGVKKYKTLYPGEELY